MKKVLILLLTASMIAAIFMGCTGPAFGSSSADTNKNGLRDDVELEILQYASDDKKVDHNDWIIEYYGTYQGNVALVLIDKNALSLGVITEETIAGFNFYFGQQSNILVWHDGKLYGLKKAYESGFLTAEEIGAIHAKRSDK